MPQTELIHGDRRQDRRYELELDLRFSYEERGVIYFGTGRTQDLSHGGVRFHTNTPPPAGMHVELRVDWPFLLQNVCPLELLIRGTILRSDSRGTTLKMSSYEFRTCGERSFAPAIARGGSCSIVG